MSIVVTPCMTTILYADNRRQVHMPTKMNEQKNVSYSDWRQISNLSPCSSNRRRNGDDYPHIGCSLYPMWFHYVGDEDITGLGRYFRIILTQKETLTFNNQDAELAVQVMGMHRKNHPGPEVEVDDPEVGGIVHQEFFHVFGVKLALRIQIYFFHHCFALCFIGDEMYYTI